MTPAVYIDPVEVINTIEARHYLTFRKLIAAVHSHFVCLSSQYWPVRCLCLHFQVIKEQIYTAKKYSKI